MNFCHSLPLAVALSTDLTIAATGLGLASAPPIGSGSLPILETVPARPVQRHQNGIALNVDILDTGRGSASQRPLHRNHAIGEKIGIKLAVDHAVAFLRA